MLSHEQKKFLLNLARETIKARLDNCDLDIDQSQDDVYDQKTGGFVTLHKNGQLRGCIGYVIAHKSLFDTIIDMANDAAFDDPRFPPVNKTELSEIDVGISILSELIRVINIEEIEIGRDGLLIRNNFSSGLLLPQVATEWKWDKITFLEQTCMKAGLSGNCWKKPDTEIFRFSAEIFSERTKK